MPSAQHTGSSSSSRGSAAWGLGLAACMCNLMIIFLPFGMILGIVAAILALLPRTSHRAPALALAGVSFVIAAVWAASIAAVFIFDPTVLVQR